MDDHDEHMPTPVENGEAAVKIAQVGGPGAVGALVAVMDANARQTERIEQLVRTGIERERDEWRERAIVAEARLARIHNRFWDLFE